MKKVVSPRGLDSTCSLVVELFMVGTRLALMYLRMVAYKAAFHTQTFFLISAGME